MEGICKQRINETKYFKKTHLFIYSTGINGFRNSNILLIHSQHLFFATHVSYLDNRYVPNLQSHAYVQFAAHFSKILL